MARKKTEKEEVRIPITILWENILMLPIVGVVDSSRAQTIMDIVLSRVAETEARILIIDISGVATVDTAVANHLIKIAQASKLMGCECIVSGISPAIAQTLIQLGVSMAGIHTRVTLRDALRYGFDLLGLEVRRQSRPEVNETGLLEDAAY